MKLKIYNETWDVKELHTQEAMQEYMEDTDSRYWGACSSEMNEIRLYSELGPKRKRATMIHEVVHAIRGMEGRAGADLDVEDLPNFVAFHFDEINKVVKEYFKPAKKKVKLIDAEETAKENNGVYNK